MRSSLPAVFLILAACGGGAFNSKLPPNERVADLSDEDFCQLQDAIEDYAENAVDEEDACYISAQFAAGFAAAFDPSVDVVVACEEAYTECLEEEPDDEEEPEACDPEDRPGEACEATVGDAEACFTAQVELYREQARLKCTAEAFESDPELEEDEGPPECDILFTPECSG